jgi:poly(hydroxyalkanoate) depolymerase family esterase
MPILPGTARQARRGRGICRRWTISGPIRAICTRAPSSRPACRQTAQEYVIASGWKELAERHGFAVLLPEQQRGNNPQRCFNWFAPGDIARGAGEAASIAAMIRTLVIRQRLAPSRVFISGLSAGGAMANAMLAAYPELFAGGAIIAGLPYGSAASATEAFSVMRQGVIRTPAEWGERVRAAAAHAGPRPPVSIWQGLADPVVNPINADELVKQWLDVMELAGAPPLVEAIDGAARHLWRDRRGRPLLTLYRLPDFGHAVPITPHAALPAARIGQAGASRFVHPGPISATWRIAQDWGLTAPVAQPSLAEAEAGAAAPARGLWHHLPGARQIEALAGTMAGADTPLGRFLRHGGLNPPREPSEPE